VAEAEAEIRRLGEALETLQERLERGGPAPARPAAGGSLREQLDEAAKQAIVEALERAGSLGAAAELLGLSRQGLWLQCKRLGLRKGLLPRG
jgi:transcriptional regulator with PAS, ATPase and Fis domain